MKVLSLGWGIQSFTLAAMVALGELEHVDYAIHADTTHERSETYSLAERMTPWLEERGVKVETTFATRKPKVINERGGVMIPAYMTTKKGDGKLSRQCTSDWKIAPLRGRVQLERGGERVEQWLGISLDEFQRMKDSDVKYITNRYPLIEKHMTRKDCVAWLQEHDLEVPVKSSCVFCPYHNMGAWKELYHSGNGDWEQAVDADERIRKQRPPYDLFIHPARIPLVDVDLRTPQEKGQLDLWANWDEECSGICGV